MSDTGSGPDARDVSSGGLANAAVASSENIHVAAVAEGTSLGDTLAVATSSDSALAVESGTLAGSVFAVEDAFFSTAGTASLAATEASEAGGPCSAGTDAAASLFAEAEGASFTDAGSESASGSALYAD